jgi:hypothetical protein
MARNEIAGSMDLLKSGKKFFKLRISGKKSVKSVESIRGICGD